MNVTTHPDRLTRKLVLLVLAALTLVSGFTLAGAGRAEALAPGAPRVLGPIGWNHEALVAWSLPFDGGKAPTSFVVERYFGDEANPQKIYVVGGHTMSLVDKGLANNQVYRFRVKAVNQDGASAWSAKEAVQPKDYRTDLAPFEDMDDYIDRQYEDLLGRAPTNGEVFEAKLGFANGDLGGDLTTRIAHDPSRVGKRFPVLRLYFAFFERSPDVNGANYWINKRTNGMNLNTIASKFAGSSEFKTKYGNLSNQAYVEAIYHNVFDRNPDANGLAYWTNKLDTKQKTRGEVMVGFSESTEYAGNGEGSVGKSTGRVEASDIWMAIMKTIPSTDALMTYYAPHIQHGGTQGTLAMLLMPTVGYPD